MKKISIVIITSTGALLLGILLPQMTSTKKNSQSVVQKEKLLTRTLPGEKKCIKGPEYILFDAFD